MSTLQERFMLLRSKRPEISNADLARMTGAKPPSVGDWFNGQTKALKADTAAKAAAVYSVNPTWLATGEGDMAPLPQSYLELGKAIEEGRATSTAQGTVRVAKWKPNDPERLVRQFEALLLKLPEANRLKAANAAYQAMIPYLLESPTDGQDSPGQ